MEFPGVLKTASGISRAICKCKNDVEIPGVIKKKSWNFQRGLKISKGCNTVFAEF